MPSLDFARLITDLPTTATLEVLKVPFQLEGNYAYVACPTCEPELEADKKGALAFCTRGLKQNLGYCRKHKRGCNILQFAEQKLNLKIRDCADLLRGEVLDAHTPNGNKPFRQRLKLEYHARMHEWCHPEAADLLQIGHCKSGIMTGHIAFQLCDESGEVVGYAGRNLKNDQERLKFPKNLDPACLLYLYHLVEGDEIFVTREPETAVKFWSHGLPMVSTLGANMLTGNQVELLRKFKHITIFKQDAEFFDNIVQQACAHWDNYWRIKTLPTTEEGIRALL